MLNGKKLSDEEQQVYKDKNTELMEKWKEEMENYTPSAEYAATAKTIANQKSATKKATKDPNAPKKPMTAFFAFMGDERENIQKDNPGIAHTEIAKKGGEMWKALSADEKKNYEDNYKTAMVKWKVDNQEYQETDGAKAFQKNARTVDIGKLMKSKSSSKTTKSNSVSKSGSSKAKSPKATKVVGASVKSKEFVSDSSSSDEEKEDNKKKEESVSSASESDSE